MEDTATSASLPLIKKLYGWVGDISHVDVSDVSGNVDEEVKQACIAILKFFVGTPAKQVYGAQAGQRLKVVDVSTWGEGQACHAQTVIEVIVEQGLSTPSLILIFSSKMSI